MRLAPVLTRGFHLASRPAATRTATTLAVRRSRLPVLHRSDLFLSDIDHLIYEVNEMMESSLATRFSRPSPSLLGRDTLVRRTHGFEVVQDEKEYKLAVNIPGVEAKDVDLRVDRDGRVLRLKGDKTYEEGGMKVQSRFEKAISLNPDVDTTKLAANMSGNILTVVAPKVETKDMLDKAEGEKIEIKVEEPKDALQGHAKDAPKVETKDMLDKAEGKKIEIEVKEAKATLLDQGEPLDDTQRTS